MNGTKYIGHILNNDEYENLDALNQVLVIIGDKVLQDPTIFAKEGYGFYIGKDEHRSESYFEVEKRFYVYVSIITPEGKSLLGETKDLTEPESEKIIERVCNHYYGLVTKERD